jgi:hypothetical protein
MARLMNLVAALMLGSGTMAQATPITAVQTEVAPGAAMPVLEDSGASQPRFMLMQTGAVTLAPEMKMRSPQEIGTSGLLAFGSNGTRIPTYQPEIVTGSIAPAGKRSRVG